MESNLSELYKIVLVPFLYQLVGHVTNLSPIGMLTTQELNTEKFKVLCWVF